MEAGWRKQAPTPDLEPARGFDRWAGVADVSMASQGNEVPADIFKRLRGSYRTLTQYTAGSWTYGRLD